MWIQKNNPPITRVYLVQCSTAKHTRTTLSPKHVDPEHQVRLLRKLTCNSLTGWSLGLAATAALVASDLKSCKVIVLGLGRFFGVACSGGCKGCCRNPSSLAICSVTERVS
jgi:hypothetical protein